MPEAEGETSDQSSISKLLAFLNILLISKLSTKTTANVVVSFTADGLSSFNPNKKKDAARTPLECRRPSAKERKDKTKH